MHITPRSVATTVPTVQVSILALENGEFVRLGGLFYNDARRE
jgi:hypothetical protein